MESESALTLVVVCLVAANVIENTWVSSLWILSSVLWGGIAIFRLIKGE